MHNETMIYGCARVSTVAQDETGQVRQLKAAGCEKVFREKITGTTRPAAACQADEDPHPPAILSSPRPLTASRATRPTRWLSRARCSAPEPVSVRWPSLPRYHVRRC
jgi:hypothetical protein